MGMFDSYGKAGESPCNLFRFAPPARELGVTAGKASLQATRVPFIGFASAKAFYRQSAGAFLEIDPDRIEAIPDGNGGTFLKWELDAPETASLGKTLLDTFAQVEVYYEDGNTAVSEPIPVKVNEPLDYLADGTQEWKEDEENGND